MSEQQLLILRGLPASGKTTFAKEWLAQDLDNRARVNRDDLRLSLHGQATHKFPQEDAVTKAEHALLVGLLKAGKSVVVDNVNLRSKYVRVYLEIAHRLGVEDVSVEDFEVAPAVAVERDSLRERPVGKEVIYSFAERYLQQGAFPPVPVLDEQTGGEPYLPDVTKPAAVLCDIDGTVALHNGRSPYDYSKVYADLPNYSVIDVVKAMRRAGYQIVFMSGRPDSCIVDTKRWLSKHIGGDFDGPFMRATDDERNDAIVKVELFDKHIRHSYNIVAAFDDRNRVVRAWRDLGLTCLQVADGNF